MDFLQSLTNPPAKAGHTDQENGGAVKPKDKVTITPLIQFLKDKKANKGKENATTAKGAKHSRQDSKDSKSAAVVDAKNPGGNIAASSPKKRSAQAVKVEQAARDAVKVLNKQAANSKQGHVSPSPSKVVPAPISPAVTPNSTANAALADKKRERGNASAAAKILQRDLGLSGHVGGRGGRRGGLLGNVANRPAPGQTSPAAKALGNPQTPQPAVSTTGNTTATATATSTDATDEPTAPAQDAAQPPARNVPPSGPAASRVSSKASASTRATPSGTIPAQPKPAAPPSTSTQAFLKHANPSQGITEPLLDEAFAVFGAINKVEIDKKKGFAYVDFADPESLQKAIKASPIKVAQGQVVVLERKTGPNLQARNVRGGGPIMGNRGGMLVGNRGGGMLVGNRGGSVRGRGGFGRGGSNFPNANNAKATNATATTASAPASNSSATSAAPPAIESVSSQPAAQPPDTAINS